MSKQFNTIKLLPSFEQVHQKCDITLLPIRVKIKRFCSSPLLEQPPQLPTQESRKYYKTYRLRYVNRPFK